MTKKHDFLSELNSRFPKIANDLGDFLKNPRREGTFIDTVKKGIKHDLLYYIITDRRLNLTNIYSMNPSYIYQIVGQVIVPKKLYNIDIDAIRSFFKVELEGSWLARSTGEPVCIGLDNQEDQDHVTISLGYSSTIDYPKSCDSLQSKMKRLTKLIHNQRIK